MPHANEFTDISAIKSVTTYVLIVKRDQMNFIQYHHDPEWKVLSFHSPWPSSVVAELGRIFWAGDQQWRFEPNVMPLSQDELFKVLEFMVELNCGEHNG